MMSTRIAGRLGAVDAILPGTGKRRSSLLGFAAPSPRRSRLALGSALFIAIAAGLALTPYFTVLAYEADVMSFLLREGEKARQKKAVAQYRAHYRGTIETAPSYRVMAVPSVHRIALPPRQAREKSQRVRTVRQQQPRLVRTGQLAYCVRTCDGYHFPLGNVRHNRDLGAQEALCGALCPGASTAVYLSGRGSDDIAKAVARDGSAYAALPAAFQHTQRVDSTCSCRPNGEAHVRLLSLRSDFTLRAGDSIMTDEGFRVFRGSKSWPLRGSDFVSLARAPISHERRLQLARLEAASRTAPRLSESAGVVLPPERPARQAAPLPVARPPALRAGFEELVVKQDRTERL